jgi:hypothetical protein
MLLPEHLRCFSLSDTMLYLCFSLSHYARHVSNQSAQHPGIPLVFTAAFFRSNTFCYTVTYPAAHAAIHICVLLILLQVTPCCVLVTIISWTVLYTSVTNSEHVYTMSTVWIWHTSTYIMYTICDRNWPATKDYMQKTKRYMNAYCNWHQNISNAIKKGQLACIVK